MPSVTAIIHDSHAQIVQRWADQAQKLASARGLRRPELLNIMPAYVRALGEAVDQEPARSRTELIERHLAARIREGFQLDEMIEEVAILGRCITDLWSGLPAEQAPAVEDVERFFAELQRAASAIVAAFHQHMTEDEQSEKHYLRRLQVIASEVMRGEPHDTSLRARLDAVLELVREAMGVQAAALVIYEPHTQTLSASAAVGLASEQLARFVEAAHGPAASALDTAAQRNAQPAALAEADVVELAADDALRERGVHSVFGILMPEQNRLLGALYIGLTEPRALSSRERRRLEAIGEQLTLHLENARLHSELRATIAEMHTERGLRERFVSVLAHDLRGPLTSARLTAQNIAIAVERNQPIRDLPARVIRSIDRADQMVRDLLDAMLIRAGKPLPLKLAPCDLVEIARLVADEINEIHGPRVRIDGPTELTGRWSGDDLRRAIWNLATNAIKYGAPDTPVVITLSRLPDAARMAVHNDGPAIPPENQAGLFQPFSRLASSTDARQGWGLGLTLVQGCVAAHGGRIDLASAPGEGTTFTVTLPLDASTVRTTSPMPRATEPQLSPLR